jgi:hypothetical protein
MPGHPTGFAGQNDSTRGVQFFPLKSTKVVNTMNQETHQKTPCSWPAVVLNRSFNFNHSFENEQRRWAMSRNMPLLSRFLNTAALASVIGGLLLSYQWGHAAEPRMPQVR